MILIGSKAANYWHPSIWSHANDIDYIATLEEFLSWHNNRTDIKGCFPFDKGKKYFVQLNDESIIEFEIAAPGSSGYSFLGLANCIEKDGILIPEMDWLFALKASHRFLKNSPHFEKTMKDYHFMKYILDCKIPNLEWFKAREKETYDYSHPKLNTSKKDFFSGDGLTYVYEHDDLHLAIAKYGFNDKPAYDYYQADNAEVMFSKKKWLECSEEIKLRGSFEEVCVLALERSQIPYEDQISPYESFKISLSKVASSITSGIFREFVYENYYKVLNMYTDDYVKWFKKGLKEGLIRNYGENEKINDNKR